jgi:opacity protein-like surface antigen
LGLAYGASTNDITPASGTADKSSASQFGINLGLIQHFSKDNAIDFSFAFVSHGVKNEGAKTNKLSATSLAVGARYFHNLGKGFVLVPVASYSSMSGTVDLAGTSADLTSYSVLNAGVGLNYRTGDLFLAGGVGLGIQSATQKSTTNTPELTNSTFIFPAWNLGAEFNVTDWMKARLGYVASTRSNTTQTAATATTKNEAVVTSYGREGVTLGLGFKFGNFNLDATVNDEVLRQGFRNIGTGAVNTFGHISASYNF